MLHHYTVGMKIEDQPGHVTVEAEDALIAALKVKHEHPRAMITYARRTNERGDQRHPDRDLPSGHD